MTAKLYGVVQDVIIEVLRDQELPTSFTIRLEPDALRELMQGLTYVGTDTPVDSSHSEVLLRILGHDIRVLSDDLAEPSLIH